MAERDSGERVRIRKAKVALESSYQRGRILWAILGSGAVSVGTLVVFHDTRIALITESIAVGGFAAWQAREHFEQRANIKKLKELGMDVTRRRFLAPGRRLRRGNYGRIIPFRREPDFEISQNERMIDEEKVN